MGTADLGRTRRLDKMYSRARDRADLHRTIDEELAEEYEFLVVGRPTEEAAGDGLANLMQPESPEGDQPT